MRDRHRTGELTLDELEDGESDSNIMGTGHRPELSFHLAICSFQLKSRSDNEWQAINSVQSLGARAHAPHVFYLYQMDSPSQLPPSFFLAVPELLSHRSSFPSPILPFPRRFLQIIQDCNRKCFWQANCIKIGRGPRQGFHTLGS